MKKILICAIAALFSTPLCVNAQAGRSAERPSLKANHSISIDLLGLHYAYEHPIGRTASIIGRAGAKFGGSNGQLRTGTGVYYGDDYWMVMPSIELEPRWYYGLDRRAQHGRYTAGNAGSFLALRVQSRFRGYASDKYYGGQMGGVTFATPVWGLRRVWQSGLLLEFTAGVRFGVEHNGDWWNKGGDAIERLDLNLRFGYYF